MWCIDEILEIILQHICQVDANLVAENAVYGLDSLIETQLHPYILQSFATSSLNAHGEIYYPSSNFSLPKNNARNRADLVLLPDGKKSIYDPVDAHKDLQRASGTLFEPVATLPAPKADDCPPNEAMWIEIKSVPQFRYVDGVPVPNTKYAQELIAGPREDVIKLASDPQIRHAGVLVIVFTELREAGPHDLSMSIRAMIDQDLPVGSPEIEQVEIQDRGGNVWCTLGLIPVRL